MSESRGREHLKVYHMGGQSYRVSRHALNRMLDMQVSADSVRAALQSPSQIFENQHPKRDRVAYCHGRIVLILDRDQMEGGIVIVTCLWRDSKKWAKDLERGEYAGRKVRISDYSEETFQQLLESTK